MVFDGWKKHWQKKKQKELSYYLLELKDEDTIYVVEQKMLEIMLADNCSMHHMWSCGYTQRMGWHEGNDGKIYEKYQLNLTGMDLYEQLKMKNFGPIYLEALEEMNHDNINPSNLESEKSDIRWNFKRHNIKSINKYNGVELLKPFEDQPIQEAITL